MAISKTIHLLGFASGLGGPDPGCSEGPVVMKKSSYLAELQNKGVSLAWEEIIKPHTSSPSSKLSAIANCCEKLAKKVYELTKNNQFFTVIGGEHTSAVGTWSGVHHALKKKGPFGLLWIDAHLDSHTPHTSHTGNIHGMPLACLLGYGMPSLTNILENEPKIKPEHLCLIGVRSFERGEAALIKELNVRVFFMEEVKQRGLSVVMKEAIEIVTQHTVGFGVSIDIDSMDPNDAPGTGSKEPHGIAAKDLCKALQLIAAEPSLLGCEIAEFNPQLDIEHKTEKLIPHLIASLVLGTHYNDVFKDCCFDSTTSSL